MSGDGASRPRRRLLQGLAATLAGGPLPPALGRALAQPALGRSGSLADVAHVVVLTQENRSFDHYFGALRGVRGFGDRFPIPLPGGRSVWQQRDRQGRERMPYPLDTRRTSALRMPGTPHTWPDAQQAWNDGRMDGWLDAKTERSLGHFRPADLPLQVALADAFTVCDAYHCSMHGGTNPNRLFLWTGHNDPQGSGGGPALVNHFESLGPAGEGYTWTTYPERLLQAGVSWKHYQDMADNFGDNPVEGFRQYRGAGAESPLRESALTSHPLSELAADVLQGRLPQVSWVIAPSRASEHPGPSSPLQGAQFTVRLIEVLARSPEVWGRTVLFVNYDENDGFFDHVPPPAPPSRGPAGRLWGASTVSLAGEHHDRRGGPALGSDDDPSPLHGRAYGLGPRVPMLVVSPWSRGGWVNSEVFDHTSVLRFLERRFGVPEPNISAWRRAVCGDLTSTLDFTRSERGSALRLPALGDVEARIAAAERLPPPVPPAGNRLPRQQRGQRPSRALPYALAVEETWDAARRTLHLRFSNHGTGGAVLQVYDRLSDGSQPPRRYTVGAGAHGADRWDLSATGPAGYDLQVHGPNGFFRAYRGTAHGPEPALQASLGPDERLRVEVHNPSRETVTLHLIDRLGADRRDSVPCPAGVTALDRQLPLHQRWYDLELRLGGQPQTLRRLAGRLEDGRHGVSDPGLA